jgi:hypothetical protein
VATKARGAVGILFEAKTERRLTGNWGDDGGMDRRRGMTLEERYGGPSGRLTSRGGEWYMGGARGGGCVSEGGPEAAVHSEPPRQKKAADIGLRWGGLHGAVAGLKDGGGVWLRGTRCKHLGPGRYVSVINDNH